jgi:hypothetical protein
MINGAHVIVYSKKPEEDRQLFANLLKLPNVDVGDGWLIFGLPPSEVAFHPGKNDEHELYLLCEDVKAFIAEMKVKKISCTPIQKQPWGSLTSLSLPGGGKIGVYEPRHERPPTKRSSARKKASRKR